MHASGGVVQIHLYADPAFQQQWDNVIRNVPGARDRAQRCARPWLPLTGGEMGVRAAAVCR